MYFEYIGHRRQNIKNPVGKSLKSPKLSVVVTWIKHSQAVLAMLCYYAQTEKQVGGKMDFNLNSFVGEAVSQMSETPK